MLLDPSTMETKVIPHFNGGEGELHAKMFTDGMCKILLGTLAPGSSIGLHTHDTTSETIYILRGTGTEICDGQEEALRPGVCHYCPKGSSHTMINTGTEELAFFAVVPVQ